MGHPAFVLEAAADPSSFFIVALETVIICKDTNRNFSAQNGEKAGLRESRTRE
jgi:hypothetical protein